VVEDERGDIAGVGIAEDDEAAALGRLIGGGFEDPEVFLGTTQGQDGFCNDSVTLLLVSKP